MIAEQLTYVYLTHENWHNHKLTIDEANQYHKRLLLNGNIITVINEDNLLGYLEFWLIDFEQFGRLVCNQPIMTDTEDLLNGNIALINNMWIDEEERNGETFKTLATMFLARCKMAEFYVAFRRTKRNQPIQVYNRNEIMNHFRRG